MRQRMKLFQRTEVWLLMALATAAGLFVLLTRSPQEEVFVTATQPAAAAQPMQLRSITLTRDHGNVRMDLSAQLTNASSRTLQLVSPTVRMRTEKGREVPLFFLPSQPPPSLPPHSTSDVKLRFWLEAADLTGSLQLEFNKERLMVKSQQPYDLQQLRNNSSLTLNPTAW